MSDPYQSAPDNPFQPPTPATAPPTTPLDTPVSGYGSADYGTVSGESSFGEPTYSGSSGSSSGGASEAAKQAGAAAGDVASSAKDRASDVASTASDHASAVAQTAQDKGKEVLDEATSQAQSLLAQVREQLAQQTQQGHQNARDSLSGIADELTAMLDGRGAQGGPASQLAEQARDRVSEVARWLEQREPGDLVNEARDFARRRPGTFLLGALIAGVAAGRLTRGVVAAHSDGSSNGGSSSNLVPAETYATTPYGTPSAGYSSSGVSGYAGAGYSGSGYPQTSGSGYGQQGGYGATDDTIVTPGYSSGSSGTGYDTGYPSGGALDQQSADLPHEAGIDGLLGSDESTVGYSAPPSTGEVNR